jgi:predicted Zn-dependent peptidase
MASDLISYLIQDKLTEWEQKQAELEQEKAALQAHLRAAQQTTVQPAQQAIEDLLLARFPDTPLSVVRDIRRITNPDRLWGLIGPLAGAATLEEARRLLADAAAANGV